ncbi:hypothetical protein P152DRAFT_478616 [Eremomyces bilateralis CBS 781.70]|uniref:Protein kinase domain-containing protein n=1 Tax=Eremomyces bilateralis CBS 781.70 TaxID=1392243 RepID=A0A6G1GDC1_9PEZI|nr:uncharacterized protein P152DRAFT_478616 [Eremomyces bilateralis CBS 781.70]KAF1816012.1 hypothetical protein P152DRAFT_478616 [Eremomyces bilateralis CBS 781.70]
MAGFFRANVAASTPPTFSASALFAFNVESQSAYGTTLIGSGDGAGSSSVFCMGRRRDDQGTGSTSTAIPIATSYPKRCDQTTPEEETVILYFHSEALIYSFSSIAESPYIFQLLEEIEEPEKRCMLFEWMDTTLWDARTEPFDAKLKIFKSVARLCLKELHPKKVVLSGFSSPSPTVKISDLGWIMSMNSPDGSRKSYYQWIQGPSLRAPDVWRGAEDYSTVMDVWSIGVRLADWMGDKAHFGPRGCIIETDEPIETTQAVWAIVKLHKTLNQPLSESLKDKEYVLKASLREQMEQLQMPSGNIGFLETLLTVNPDRRPSPAEALDLPFVKE